MEYTVDVIITILIILMSIGLIGLRTAIELKEIERSEEDEI